MIITRSSLDISASVEAARQSQRAALRLHFTGCPECGRALSIAEIIERHCENCERDIEPRTMRAERAAA
ncbi:hypothetical protein SAMN02982989_3387 [Xaviernesmea oryzae]|uniref:Uncharacterized protein n=1 Tax=Xaviernesmea oryzae TaxID=464029 RepID=A0A1X7G842_9HYPH|nr:hypothetical protein [Xaviernesmea oryzae]SMF65648.1 hypothetical protein SAMN02982989_3387 [Xaviernesmea oryzae]